MISVPGTPAETEIPGYSNPWILSYSSSLQTPTDNVGPSVFVEVKSGASKHNPSFPSTCSVNIGPAPDVQRSGICRFSYPLGLLVVQNEIPQILGHTSIYSQ